MNTSIDKDLKKILLRRRNKVIIDSNQNICDVYKNEILNGIKCNDNLKNCCYSIESINETVIIIKFNNILLEFENGEIKKNIKEIETFESEFIALSKIIKEETEKIQKRMVLSLSFNENLNNLGYSMDENMFRVVSTFSTNEIDELNKELIPALKEIIGDNVWYNPLYPNFPKQVIEEKRAHLYLYALLHYWTNGKFYPFTEVEERNKTPIEVQYKNITIGKEEDIHELMYNLMNAAESISEQDIKDLETYFNKYKDFNKYIPETICNKENLAIITNLIIKNSEEIPIDKIIPKFNVVTDVLRLSAVMSGNSASLNNKIKFKSFSNRERRLLMQLLNNCGNRLEDFFRYRNLWERVCERIHPGKYRSTYPDLVDDLLGAYKFKKNSKAYKKEIESYEKILNWYNIFNNNPKSKSFSIFIEEIEKLFKIRPKIPNEIFEYLNNAKCKCKCNDSENEFSIDVSIIKERHDKLNVMLVESSKQMKEYKQNNRRFSSKVEAKLSNKEFDEAMNLLSQKPGVFSRRLDELLSKVSDDDKVIGYFENIAPKVSVKVLLSLKGYFQNRFKKLKVRVFLIKGKVSKHCLKTKVKEELDMSVCEKICEICDKALINHFKDKPKLNNVYLSEKMKKQIIPLDIRSASSAMETYSKGSRFDLFFKKLTAEEQEQHIKDLNIELANNEEILKKNEEELSHLKNDLANEEKTEEEKKKINDEIVKVNNKIRKINEEISNNKNMIEFANSRLGKDKCNKVRLFIWWTNTKKDERVDIDLSVMIYDENLVDLGHVSFKNLGNDKYKIYHSGDIVDGGDFDGDGVAEFIDFDPDEILSNGGRYIATSVISFNGLAFNKLDNCKFGWMEREDLNSNELFEPKTVRQKLDINTEKTSTTPVIFDCKTREIVWVDATLTGNKICVCIENSKEPMNAILYYYLNPLKCNMYDLFDLHIQARGGKLVNTEEELSEGDVAFVPYLPYKCKEGVKYIRPTDLDIVLSEYMTSALD
ncbi:hypothetical protein BCR36DRAFT_581226 [Piromyces finnis]|uniref:Uncharacterized protein n=1 Tax=Piromyces finnis TaxID=1754191 RepID=A0A1Y1VHY8_9FUNG|nr:hypothetical protein BCR36DRAFT_581226 [Piromyces finnis]|eukprot:ORX56081.1 hypothetical protein BCR36DRAFT_581226 [Piromyces finnis]